MTALRCSFYLLCTCVLAACSSPKLPSAQGALDPPPPPDYATPDNWAALPTKQDNADRTPGDELSDRQATAKADVFYIHPTLYRKPNDYSKGWNATLYDPITNERVDEQAILNQASIFNAAGRVYAPRYRQANIKVYYREGQAMAERALQVAYEDVLAAFDHYLNYYNDGRPIIIAAHSQGTTHAKRLLADRFDGQALNEKLVAAYLVGMPVNRNAYRTIPVCESATQTGCFVSWRTYRYDFEPRPGYRDTVPDIAVVNPLSWTTDTALVGAEWNKGGVLLNYNQGPKENLVWAQIRGAGLFTSKPDFFGDVFFRAKNYHIADYNLFWVNVRENAVARTDAYFAKKI